MAFDPTQFGATPVGMQSNNSFDPTQYGATKLPSTSTVDVPATKQPSFLQKVGNFFTGSTQKFGKTIGGALAANKNTDLYTQALQQHTDLANNLRVAIAQKQAKGQDASGLINTLNSLMANTPKQEDFTGQVINKTPEQVLGEAGGTALEALSGGILDTGVGAVAKDVSLGQKVAQGAKVGAAYGAASGLTGAAQNNGSVGNLALNTFVGASVGAGLGAATEGVIGGTSKVIQKTKSVLNPTEQDVAKARQYVAGQYEKTLNLTPSQKAKEGVLLQKTGDNVYTTAVKYGINLGSDKAPQQMEDVSNMFRQATDQAKNNEPMYFNLGEIKANADARIDENIPSAVSRQQAKDKIANEINAMIQENPSQVIPGHNGELMASPQFTERLRQTGNSWTPFNASDPEKVGQSTGFALSNAVRDQVEKQGTFPAYREANKEWGKIIHLQEIYNKLEASGKNMFKVPGGLSGAIARRVLSGAIGFHTGGLGGAVLGEVGSEYGARIMANPELRTYFDRLLIKNNGVQQTPEVITKLAQQVKEYVDSKGSQLALPAAGEASAKVITPSPTSYEPMAQKVNGDSVTPILDRLNQSYTPAENLSSNDKKIEQAAYTHLMSNPQGIVKEYAKITDTANGKIINPDIVRRLFESDGYNGTNSAAVQEPSSLAAKLLYELSLKNKGDSVFMTAGGSGVGKSSALNNLPLVQKKFDQASTVFDGNMSSYGSAVKRIKQAIAAGKQVNIAYIYRDPIDAWNGVIGRMLNNPNEMGRIVPASVVAKNHVGSYDVVKKILEKTPRGVNIDFINNSGGKNTARLMSPSEFENIKYPSVEELHSQFAAEAKKYYEKGKVTKEQYKALIK